MERSVVEPAVAFEAGQIVDFMTIDGRWIGRGVYNPHSRIRLRLYERDAAQELDAAWCIQRAARALELRERWFAAHERLSAVRLINSEGDGLSGLIVDRFGDYLVIQLTARAMLNWLEPLTDWLQERLQPKGILLRTDARTAAHEGMEPREETLRGESPPGPIELEEHGIRLRLDLVSGQKTGYYLDQRANRRTAAGWIGKGPLLDVCCYHGGFALAAARWGEPESITAVDSSMRALEQASQNAELNGYQHIDFVQADCFDYLEHLVEERQQFETVILDPPRMAGNRNQINAALRAYHRLNLSALNLLSPGGMLITCSCSGRVTRSDFIGMLASVSQRAKRAIQIVETHGADFDHPVDVNCPEGEYLKCFICRVW